MIELIDAKTARENTMQIINDFEFIIKDLSKDITEARYNGSFNCWRYYNSDKEYQVINQNKDAICSYLNSKGYHVKIYVYCGDCRAFKICLSWEIHNPYLRPIGFISKIFGDKVIIKNTHVEQIEKVTDSVGYI